MIKKIIKLQDVGIYKDYLWPEDLPEFQDFNLIYGWNYSGKTTLSRLFGVLEKPDTRVRLGGSFEVEYCDGSTISSAGLIEPLNCRVFNRPFIERNFQEEHNAPAVFIVGDDANKLRSRIARLQKHKIRVDGIKSHLATEKREWERRVNDGLKRDGARAISDLVSERNFDRRDLDELLRQVSASPQVHILSESEFDALKATANSSDTFSEQRHFSIPDIDVTDIVTRVSRILSEKASNNAIDKLKDRTEMEAWVRQGKVLHVDETECGFCGNVITQDRLGLLAGHFSTEYEALIRSVEDELSMLSYIDLELRLPIASELIPSVRVQYSTAISVLDDYMKSIKIVVDVLIAKLKEKSTNIETALEIPNEVADEIGKLEPFSYTEVHSEISSILKDHNNKITDLDATKVAAKEKLKKHSAASFYVSNDIESEIEALDKINAQETKSSIARAFILQKILEKEEEIKQHSVAVGKLNELIEIILSGSNISAVQLSESEFEFRRGADKAENLSDGERAAIAFSYFILTLEDGGNSLSDTLIFVDDPISSLDSNHIYAIYALIIERLKGKCRQLFVSTHNYEFFNLLKDESLNNNKNFKHGNSGYFTQRKINSDGEPYADLVELPKPLRKYKSEYQFVFSLMYEFFKSTEPTLHEAYTSPTILRKFLEAYLGFRKPTGGAWHQKLELLFDDEAERREVSKFADDASHMQNIRRIVEHAEYISSSKEIIGKVINALSEKDQVHYDDLKTLVEEG